MTALRLRPPAALRWAAVGPAAVLAAGAAQLVSMGLAGLTFPFEFLYGSGDAIWAVKSVASVLMGAAFVGAAAWTAPAGRRGVAAVAAAVVLAWALALLALGGLDSWGPVLGGAGTAGALAALAVVWRREA